MKDNVVIRPETEKDYRVVEELTREAFWNVYKPGADEHYFVHEMRAHPDFIPELAFVLELDGRIVGNFASVNPPATAYNDAGTPITAKKIWIR